MTIKFVTKFLPTCLPSGLTVAAPDAFGRIPGVDMGISQEVIADFNVAFFSSKYLSLHLP